MRKILLVVCALLLFAIPAMAQEWSGAFEFEVRTDTDVTTASDTFGDISATLDYVVDDYNTITVELCADMADGLMFDDMYLSTKFSDNFSTKLGAVSIDSNDYSVSGPGHELVDAGFEGNGLVLDVAYGNLAVSVGGAPETEGDYGITVGYNFPLVPTYVEVGYFRGNEITTNVAVTPDLFSIGAGIAFVDNELSYGMGVKREIWNTWLGMGINNDCIWGLDTGLDMGGYGIDFDVSFLKVDFTDCGVSAWCKWQSMTITIGDDYTPDLNEVYAMVEVEF